jgi:hypothetical protein
MVGARDSVGAASTDPKRMASAALIEDLAQVARERFGLSGINGLTAHEAAMVAGEHCHMRTKCTPCFP